MGLEPSNHHRYSFQNPRTGIEPIINKRERFYCTSTELLGHPGSLSYRRKTLTLDLFNKVGSKQVSIICLQLSLFCPTFGFRLLNPAAELVNSIIRWTDIQISVVRDQSGVI